MPIYLFKKGKKLVEVVLGMNDPKIYKGESGNEEGWERVWTVPKTSVDTKIDPFSSKEFVEKTAKKGTVGDLLDRSKEMSIKRQEKNGVDPIKESYYKDWSKLRKNRCHPEQAKEQLKSKLKNNKHFDIED